MRSFSQRFDDFSQDLKHALRGLRQSPGFAVSVIVALALGIGANTAMFGIVDRLMFRPYPYLKDPSTVHRICLRHSVRGTTRSGRAAGCSRCCSGSQRRTLWSTRWSARSCWSWLWPRALRRRRGLRKPIPTPLCEGSDDPSCRRTRPVRALRLLPRRNSGRQTCRRAEAAQRPTR